MTRFKFFAYTSFGAVAALAALLLLPAAGATPRDAHWSWAQAVPGTRISPSAQTVALASRAAIDPTNIRVVTQAALGGQPAVLLAGRTSSGDRCFALRTEIMHASFACLSTLAAGGEAIVTFKASGGADQSQVEWSSVIGIARDDVARIEAQLTDGTSKPVGLNGWRAFSAQSRGGTQLAEILALDSDGNVIDSDTFSAAAPTAR